MKIRASELFSLDKSLAGDLLGSLERPWEILGQLSEFIVELGGRLERGEVVGVERGDFVKVSEGVWVSREAKIAPQTTIIGPTILDAGCELRPGAFLRGDVLLGKNCVIGNSTELKNCLIFDEVALPHFNYVGDSIIGAGVHLAAGVIVSNLRLDQKEIGIKNETELIMTGRRKLGGLIGDGVEVIGRGVKIWPLQSVSGVIENDWNLNI